jgi:hypothetical protein
VPGVKLSPELRRIGRNSHRLGRQDPGDGVPASLGAGSHLIDGIANDGRDRHVTPPRLAGYPPVTRLVKENLNAALKVWHVHTLVHVARWATRAGASKPGVFILVPAAGPA